MLYPSRPLYGDVMADRNADAIRHDRDRFIGFAFASADLLLELTGDLQISWAVAPGCLCSAWIPIGRSAFRWRHSSHRLMPL